MTTQTIRTDFLIIGSGAAGLSAALHASKVGRVLLLTKSDWNTSSSYRAQGGIAAVLQDYDSYQSHKQDTLEAGRWFCDEEAVDLLVKEGAHEIKRYIEMGMDFDRSNGRFDLGLEGGHSNRRVLHANGAETGRALIEFLSRLVKAEPNINVIEQTFVYDLLTDGETCYGAAAYQYRKNETLLAQSPVTILATGGYAGLFERSTNPHTSTGDGVWLAYNGGAELQDMEFVQFHPTAFYSEDGKTFLISEAVRGEGARLYNQEGERFMADIKQQELAPRDVVSEAIFHQIQQQELDYVYLDIRHLDTEKICSHFRGLFDKIEAGGIDVEEEGIPVAPAAHYCIGGVATNIDGRTSLKNLYACGEAAATGVHGANRLASNSLLECLVFSKQAVSHAVNTNLPQSSVNSHTLNSVNDFVVSEEKAADFINLTQKISDLLTTYAGIYRNREGLKQALQKLDTYSGRYSSGETEYYSIRSNGLLQLSRMIIKAAIRREGSRGVHIRSDFPDSIQDPKHISFQNQVTIG